MEVANGTMSVWIFSHRARTHPKMCLPGMGFSCDALTIQCQLIKIAAGIFTILLYLYIFIYMLY